MSYGFELQLGGAVEISPRALEVLKPALHTTIIIMIIMVMMTMMIIIIIIIRSRSVFLTTNHRVLGSVSDLILKKKNLWKIDFHDKIVPHINISWT